MSVRNPRVTNTLVFTSQARPLMPMYRLRTSCFHVDATRATSPSSPIAMARGIPTASTSRRASSTTAHDAPDSQSASGRAVSTSSQAARVLRIVAFSFAVTSDPLLSGRVAMNGVSS